ncbi:MAG: F0F1 ATP synthase subunit B [Phycisphaerae bacterium]|nr:F0F1 ATP synthase subunit B [Phycisphaerae bacterium]
MLQLLLAQLPLATGGAAHGGGTRAEVLDLANWLPGVTALVVFGIAFGVLGTVVWPKITKALDDRERKIRSEIEGAEKARGDAEAAKAKFEKDLAVARDESSRMLVQAKADAQRIADDLRARAETDLQERLTKADAEIEGAKRAAIAEIHARGAELATAIAGKILQRSINETDQHRLVEESLAELARHRN